MQETKTTKHLDRLRKTLRSALAIAVGVATMIGSGTLLAEAVHIKNYGSRSNIRQGVHAAAILRNLPNLQPQYLFLGDSLSMANSGGGYPPPFLIAKAIRDSKGRHHFRNLSIPGFTILSHYFLNAPIVETPARKVIIGFNMGWVSRPTENQPRGLEGFLPPEQWFAAMQLPIGAFGLTGADILSAGIVDQLGLRPGRGWLQEIQSAIYRTYKSFVSNFQKWVGAPRGMATNLNQQRYQKLWTKSGTRLNRTSTKLVLGRVLEGLDENEPTLVILGELIRRLRDKGSEVLVLAQPMNVEHLRTIGMLEDGGLQTSIQRLRDVAQDNGADFLDLHQALPDHAFRDEGDHINFQDSSNPAATIAEPLIKWILKP